MKSLSIENNNLLSIAGVKKVVSCTQTQAIIDTDSSKVVVSGNEIEVKKLDLQSGEISLLGNFHNIKLQTATEKKGLLKRIFK